MEIREDESAPPSQTSIPSVPVAPANHSALTADIIIGPIPKTNTAFTEHEHTNSAASATLSSLAASSTDMIMPAQGSPPPIQVVIATNSSNNMFSVTSSPDAQNLTNLTSKTGHNALKFSNSEFSSSDDEPDGLKSEPENVLSNHEMPAMHKDDETDNTATTLHLSAFITEPPTENADPAAVFTPGSKPGTPTPPDEASDMLTPPLIAEAFSSSSVATIKKISVTETKKIGNISTAFNEASGYALFQEIALNSFWRKKKPSLKQDENPRDIANAVLQQATK